MPHTIRLLVTTDTSGETILDKAVSPTDPSGEVELMFEAAGIKVRLCCNPPLPPSWFVFVATLQTSEGSLSLPPSLCPCLCPSH